MSELNTKHHEKESPGGAFLSGEDLRRVIEDEDAICQCRNIDEGEVIKESIELGEEWSDWTCDLSLGKEVYLSSDDEIRFLDENEDISIDPGEFALLMTEEHLNIPPDKAALISLKFSQARKGLINISGFHVDPNYTGQLTISVYNASPSSVVLRKGEPFFMIVFTTLSQSLDDNREDAQVSNLTNIKPGWIEGLKGRTASLENLSEKVNELERITARNRDLLNSIAVGLIIALFSVVGGIIGQMIFNFLISLI